MNKRPFKKGFTLIELLVVISIIGLLSSIIIASMNGARLNADDAVKAQTVRQLILALEMYFNENGSYPVPTMSSVSPLNNLDPSVNSTGYIIYNACLKSDSYGCVYNNRNMNDAEFSNKISKYIKTPLAKTLPVNVYYPNLANNYDVGGIEYDCTPTAPGQTPMLLDTGKCMSYMLSWVYHKKNIACAGGYSKTTNPSAIGYQNTNTSCVYTNNENFVTAFWNHGTLPAPELTI